MTFILQDNFQYAIYCISDRWKTSKIKNIRLSALGIFICEHSLGESDYLYRFIQIYLNSSAFFQWWFYAYIPSQFKHHFDAIVKNCLLLQQYHLFYMKNFNTLLTHHDNKTVSLVLEHLQRARLLTQKNFDALLTHKYFKNIASILPILQTENLLHQENLDGITTHPQPKNLVQILIQLQKLNFLNQDSLGAMTAPQYAILLLPEIYTHLWCRLPEALLKTQWLRILELSCGDSPILQLLQLTNQLLGIPNHPITTPPVYNPQSTHIASVHQSSSESAMRLKQRYKRTLPIKQLQTYISGLPQNFINQAATKAIKRITAPDYNFTDPKSNISIRHLLALAFTAIQDDSQRIGLKHDALQYLIHGLYEIQREYNCNELGIDNHTGADLIACPDGTFNKIIEKLQGIHPDASIIHITPERASVKLLIVVTQQASQYLAPLTSPQTLEAFEANVHLFEQLQQNADLTAIWDKIKASIYTIMFDEFGSLYHSIEDPRFTELIEHGSLIPLKNLNFFKIQLLQHSKQQPWYRPSQHVQMGLFKSHEDFDQDDTLTPQYTL